MASISTAAVATINRATPAQATMVAPFTGLKSSSAFPVTRKTADITSLVSNGGRVQCMKVWPPLGLKKFETLSYLPPLSREQLLKEIDYLLRMKWIPCLEFELEHPFVYRENNRSPGYYDGRYWVMWKLPMFGCTDPVQVLKELDEAVKEYPTSHVRIIGFDNNRQVQCISFIAYKPHAQSQLQKMSAAICCDWIATENCYHRFRREVRSFNHILRDHFQCQQPRRKLPGPQRASKVKAYYGLKTPPYKLDALEPFMSRRTLEMHWGEHHHDYVEGLNKQLENNDILYGYTMNELIKVTYNNGNPLPEFNNAAQVWNHDFFWESMQPGGGNMPMLGLLKQIEKDFGSFTNFREKFTEAAVTLFGSGWVWLVLKRNQKQLAVVKTSNAINPLVWGDIPIVSLDMWEHAYYLDYKNDRGKYVNVFMNHLVSWNAAAARMARAQAFVNLGEPKIPVA